jgi:hypothetical protein
LIRSILLSSIWAVVSNLINQRYNIYQNKSPWKTNKYQRLEYRSWYRLLTRSNAAKSAASISLLFILSRAVIRKVIQTLSRSHWHQ